MPEAIEALPSGQRLSEWIEAAPIGKTATYELMKALGVTPAKARFPGSAAAVSLLMAEQVAVMDGAAEQVAAGRSIAELTSITARPRTTANDHGEAVELDVSVPDRTDLLARIEAADGAIRSGVPLSTAEVSWILGALARAAGLPRLARSSYRVELLQAPRRGASALDRLIQIVLPIRVWRIFARWLDAEH
jgi:hypothetical protein